MLQILKSIFERIQREPVATMAMLRAGLIAAMAFGFNLSSDQMAAVLMFTEMLLAWITRSQVTPTVPPAPPAQE